jgi:pyruvate dehydrogenase E2 component (dihydrolipoyllysine-residue acetyltransferase)
MATQVVMPKLSPTMEEGQLSRWLKREGDKVTVGEPIAEIDTDKATMEAQALAEGVLRKIVAPEGSTVPLGQVIAIIGAPDEDISSLLSEVQSGAAGAENKANAEQVEGGQYGSQQEIAGVVAEGDRTQATMQGQPLKGEVGGDKAKGGEVTAAQPASGAPERPSAQGERARGTQAQGERTAEAVGSQSSGGNGQRAGGRLVVSPVAARMAADANINLRDLAGSGPGGRIVKRDIEAAMKSGGTRDAATQTQGQQTEARPEARATQQPAPQSQQQAAPPQSTLQAPRIEGAAPYRDEPLTTMRATIARRLVTSIGPVPHFFLTSEIEMDRAADIRKQLNALDESSRISLNDIIIKVAAVALRQHPRVNASFHEKSLRYYERADIGVAVAIEDGLITPVVRGAESKSIGQISREVRELAERARSRRLKPEEYTGATFSISNLGMFGIDEFTAVINPPEAAILAVGAATPKPVVRDGQVVVRQIMRVTMSCDHRVIDGATGAQFLQTFKRILENPPLLLA